MKLQTEIFLWIGILFIISGLIALFSIEWSTSNAISKIEPIFNQEMETISKQDRKVLFNLIKKNQLKDPNIDEIKGMLNVNGKVLHYAFSKEELKDHPVINLFITHQKGMEHYSQKVKSELTHLKWHVSITASIIGALILLIMLILLRTIAKRISHPICTLAEAMQEVVKGKYPNVKTLSEGKHIVELNSLITSFEGMVQSLKDREKIRSLLDKVVSTEIAEKILQGDISLGGEIKVISVLFADIRNFTKMTEHMPPEEVITLLNKFMTHMTEIIHHHGGVIDKYIGDEIMALFGAPVANSKHSSQALKAAIAMQKEIVSLNQSHEKNSMPILNIGIGVHTGSVLIGNMGAESRLNYTAIGSNVNLASRLCSNAKPGEILISEETFKNSPFKDSTNIIPSELKEFKGFSEKLRTYSIQ
jgi:class 3 adenylate cyclase